MLSVQNNWFQKGLELHKLYVTEITKKVVIGSAIIDRGLKMTKLLTKDESGELNGGYCQNSKSLDKEKKLAETMIYNNYNRERRDN